MTTPNRSPENCFQTLQTEVTTLDQYAANPQQAQGVQTHVKAAVECIKDLNTLLSTGASENKIWLEKNGSKVKTVVEKCQNSVDKLQSKNLISNTTEFETQYNAINKVLSKYSGQQSGHSAGKF